MRTVLENEGGNERGSLNGELASPSLGEHGLLNEETEYEELTFEG